MKLPPFKFGFGSPPLISNLLLGLAHTQRTYLSIEEPWSSREHRQTTPSLRNSDDRSSKFFCPGAQSRAKANESWPFCVGVEVTARTDLGYGLCVVRGARAASLRRLRP